MKDKQMLAYFQWNEDECKKEKENHTIGKIPSMPNSRFLVPISLLHCHLR